MAQFEYKAKNWKDYPVTTTPITANDLNRIDSAVERIVSNYATTGNLQDAIASVASKGMATTVIGTTDGDLDDFAKTGFYYFGGPYRATANYPGSGAGTGWLLVIDGGEHSNRKVQIWFSEENLSEVFYRHTDSLGTKWITPGWTMLLNSHNSVPINCGGTGATNARQAYQNLAIVDVAEAINLNNVTDTGIYSLQNMSTITNAPDGVALGCVYVAKLPIDGTSGARIEQILIGGTNNVSKHKVYIRHGQGDDTGTTWADWCLIYNSGLDTSGTLTLSSAVGADGRYQTMADKVVEVTIGGTFAPTAAGKTTITTLPFGFIKAQSFICHDMTHNTPLEATLSKTGELSIDFKSTGQQRLTLHETFICK